MAILAGCTPKEESLSVEEVSMSLDQIYEVVESRDKAVNEEILDYGQEDAKAFEFSGGNILYIYQFESKEGVKEAIKQIEDNDKKPNMKVDASLRTLEIKNILILYYPTNLNRPFSEQDEKILSGIKSKEELQQFLKEKHEKILEEQKLEGNIKD